MQPGIVPSNPADEARRQQLYRQLASLPPDVRQFIGEQYGASQITVLPLPYWSTMRFQSVLAAGPPVTLTIDTTPRKAFAYAQGQSPAIAGFPAAFGNATPAETNLLKASETRDNADVWIWGIAAHLTPESEPSLARRVWRDSIIELALNGTQNIPLGTLEMFPGAGGLYGAATSAIKEPSLPDTGGGPVDNGVGGRVEFLGNGMPLAGNFFRLPQPFKWSSSGTPGADSALVITGTPQRAIVETAGLVRAAAAGVGAFTPPGVAAAIGTFVDVRFHLICVAVSRRSQNV